MKQYEAKEGEYLPISETGTIIILTVEELREVWEAAEKRMMSGPVNRNYKGDFLSDNPDFTQFCQSQGIKL